MGRFGVNAWGVKCYNLSISDMMMDCLINNDSIDRLYLVMPRAADESVCAKLSHTSSMRLRCENRHVTEAPQAEKKHLMFIKTTLLEPISGLNPNSLKLSQQHICKTPKCFHLFVGDTNSLNCCDAMWLITGRGTASSLLTTSEPHFSKCRSIPFHQAGALDTYMTAECSLLVLLTWIK